MANKTEFIFLPGKVKWCRPQVADPWGSYKTVQYLEGDALEKVRELQGKGLKNILKKDDDGYHVTWRRPQQKMIRGKVVGFAPPEVLGSDNLPLRDTNIGNGSDCTIKLCVYEHKTPGGGEAIAARWEAVRVDNLVPFDNKSDFNEDEEKAVRGMDKQPSPF